MSNDQFRINAIDATFIVIRSCDTSDNTKCIYHVCLAKEHDDPFRNCVMIKRLDDPEHICRALQLILPTSNATKYIDYIPGLLRNIGVSNNVIEEVMNELRTRRSTCPPQ
jgi:hypothetical protein